MELRFISEDGLLKHLRTLALTHDYGGTGPRGRGDADVRNPYRLRKFAAELAGCVDEG